ncbi:glycoside hydrolase family 3 C-terminal domain-containing protein [Faecalibacterium prausnitzii]|uniref:Beta-glucosidase n=1 Tax=Faecalibacterium prausnitzii TaxID=853 RepID=A0A3E2UG21_9FIRM|nr:MULTISPECIES: glycoside hydrolase family 3 N-terminal domain-containing protein [Faecalibacterium]AXB27516.1 beta-glucosidase [Faecalibacterium prausnitzii]MBV0928284.1 glycoside hydrolase family 3 C-terminal domain-containing protein [Faecalibacterium prausnitzii]MCG4794463.1 glycoside hydrolase family 3 C-terminal domain-containing protein [Faecalibacterium prausnitzii]MCG4800339.1 glycoside hydrolase family 3 C-terminal domain-containing protein [Faecalibacterium prausnitzii]MDE8725331.1
MLSINMDDVIKVLNSIKSQLIGFGVVAVLLIAVMIACRKQSKSKKYLIRWQAGLGMVLALAITVNLILTGPMYSMVTLATGGGKVSEENVASATQLCENIADEGIVLLDNDGTLPMAKNSKLNVFGWASTNPCYGGTGSGALSDAYPTVTLLEGLKNAGFELNTELSDFYTSYRADRPEVGMFSQDWTLPEPEAAQYTDEMMNNAKAFSDTAMVVITRVGGEGADLPTDVSQVTYDAGHSYNDFEPGDHYLQLSKTEKDMIDLVCKNFDKVVVVYNGANAMELGWVKDYSQIKSVVWCAGTGQSGFNALGSILCGDVNPSGRTIDTFVYDLTQTPTANNFGNFTYTNMDEFKASSFGADTIPAFVNYVEGIYVGYKFYETAAAEGLIDYDKTVVYPFGRGLSYTTFTQTLNSVTEADGTITVDVTVTNTGSASGKEVVEVYYNPPYTNGGIEKASANLIGFAKTSELAPGASENVTVTFKAEDMASYDTYGKGCYVLEKGDYVISINADSHTVLDSKVYNVASDIVYDASNKRESDVEVADNKFDFAEGNVTYLSRADGFANYAEATAAPADFELPAEAKATFYNNSNWNPEDFNNADDVAPTTGAKNGLKLKDMVGVDYNDAQWDTFLDQLTVSDMDSLIALGGYQSVAVSSIGKVQAIDCDGPASINNNFTQQGSIGFPSAVMIAATWNTDLAHDFGTSIGKMADDMDVSGWYAPAMNIHRSAFAGRNFEYYSEDGVLSGAMAANAIMGSQEQGVYAFMKHFALNDQETNRCGMLCTWSNEQAIREIYLKPFEISVKDADCHAVMSSFNYIGTRWTGGCKELLKNVLRGEWGFVGFVETDYFGVSGYMTADQCVRNGNDLMLCTTGNDFNTVTVLTNSSKQALRESAKNILYTVVNSRAYAEENLNPGMAKWQIVLIGADVLVALLFVTLEVKTLKGYKKRKEEEVNA